MKFIEMWQRATVIAEMVGEKSQNEAQANKKLRLSLKDEHLGFSRDKRSMLQDITHRHIRSKTE